MNININNRSMQLIFQNYSILIAFLIWFLWLQNIDQVREWLFIYLFVIVMFVGGIVELSFHNYEARESFL